MDNGKVRIVTLRIRQGTALANQRHTLPVLDQNRKPIRTAGDPGHDITPWQKPKPVEPRVSGKPTRRVEDLAPHSVLGQARPNTVRSGAGGEGLEPSAAPLARRPPNLGG